MKIKLRNLPLILLTTLLLGVGCSQTRNGPNFSEPVIDEALPAQPTKGMPMPESILEPVSNQSEDDPVVAESYVIVEQNVIVEPNLMSKDLIAELDLKLLLTDFYSSELGQNDGYGYYIYLAFADRSDATWNKRLMAAEAFMCSFSSATDADVQQIPLETIALFLAPLVSNQDLLLLNQSRYPKQLLQSYSYTEGQLFQNKLATNNQFESIAVIGSRTMLNPRDDAPFPDHIEVLDLSHFSAHAIKETIVGLRKVVISKPGQEGTLPQFAPLQHPQFALRLASFFESVGQGMISLITIQTATADQRECL